MGSSNGAVGFGEYPSIALGGKTKIGKSSAVINAFAGRCFYVACERNALVPAFNPEINRTLVRAEGRPFRPWHPQRGVDFVECLADSDPIGEVNDVLDQVEPRLGVRGGFAAVAIDTMSELVDRDFRWGCDAGPGGGRWSFKYATHYRTLYDRVKGLVRRLQRTGVIVVATFHEQEPQNIEGKFKPGGLNLPGQLVRSLPSLFDFVLRCGIDTDGAGQPRAVFRCDRLDTEYVTGDRYGVMNSVEPMDLRSVYRRAVFAARGQWDEVLKIKRGAAQAIEGGGSGGVAAPSAPEVE